MTESEQRVAAEKLANAVRDNTNGAYDDWVASGDALKTESAQADFIQRHAGLSQPPSPADVKAIHDYIASSLQGDVAEIQQRLGDAHAVGLMCLSDDD
jgi:hypothetical protein